jgi:predicted DNA-binding protein
VYQIDDMSEKPKTKHWTYRGETKAVAYRLPIETVDKLDALAKQFGMSKTQVLIEAIDGKAKG